MLFKTDEEVPFKADPVSNRGLWGACHSSSRDLGSLCIAVIIIAVPSMRQSMVLARDKGEEI